MRKHFEVKQNNILRTITNHDDINKFYLRNIFLSLPVDCNSPPVPQHGSMTANGSHATYTCQIGYSLNGDPVRTCATDGTGWSGSEPVCSKYNINFNFHYKRINFSSDYVRQVHLKKIATDTESQGKTQMILRKPLVC